MNRWIRITTGPVFWITAVQIAWTVLLVLWILYFTRGHGELGHPAVGGLVAGILLLVLMLAGVVMIVIHFARQVVHNRAVKDFISQVSHDLRSPLATVKLHLETIQLRALDPEQTKECLSLALHELARLEVGIEDVLLASRLDRRRLTISAEHLDIAAFLTNYVAAKRDEVRLKGGILEIAELNAIIVRADPALLRQLLDNLVDNAVRHCQPGVKIAVSVHEQSGCAVIDVVDNGPGLDLAERKRVFRMFYRSRNPKYSRGGTGLGLFIVAGIAKSHGGRTWVECLGPGCGCQFRVALPVTPEEESPS